MKALSDSRVALSPRYRLCALLPLLPRYRHRWPVVVRGRRLVLFPFIQQEGLANGGVALMRLRIAANTIDSSA